MFKVYIYIKKEKLEEIYFHYFVHFRLKDIPIIFRKMVKKFR